MGARSVLLSLVLSAGAFAQLPWERMKPIHREEAQAIVRNPDFTFETRTQPMRVKLNTMERLFENPRLAAAMWRACDFAPRLFAVELPEEGITIDDSRGLGGTLTLIHRSYGHRIYLIKGLVKKGRMGNPFDVGAEMVVSYRYWDAPDGFRSYLQTWTSLDSAMLSVVSRPFRSYIRKRQQEFIEYINFNMAQGGEFAQRHPYEFREPLKREGDAQALRQFDKVFGQTAGGGRQRR